MTQECPGPLPTRPMQNCPLAGSTAFALGIAFGMWACTEWEPEHVTDLIPADYVTSSILLAATADVEQVSGLAAQAQLSMPKLRQ